MRLRATGDNGWDGEINDNRDICNDALFGGLFFEIFPNFRNTFVEQISSTCLPKAHAKCVRFKRFDLLKFKTAKNKLQTECIYKQLKNTVKTKRLTYKTFGWRTEITLKMFSNDSMLYKLFLITKNSESTSIQLGLITLDLRVTFSEFITVPSVEYHLKK